MSYELTILAFAQKNLSSSEKHVLTILCFRANEKNECWPSIKCIVHDSNLDEKTVQNCLISLANKNLIEKTGEMKGKTKRVPCYRILINTPKNGGVQKLNTPNFSANAPKSGGIKCPQKRGTEYKDLNINKNAYFSLFQEYLGRIKSDKLLGLIDKDTKEPTYEEWLIKFDNV